MTAEKLKLYDCLESGTGSKVRLLLAQLTIPFERIELDITRGETHTLEFEARNPNGRIPTLELEDGTCLAESNAIQWYLADGTAGTTDVGALDAQSTRDEILATVQEMDGVTAFPPTIGRHCAGCPYLYSCEVRDEIAARREREGW